ncbi:MAG: EAL domain-containing protein [Magnetococcales bacterium]|nr:EAL domain-containing protein [Magnetococcales bacterium]
MSDKRPFPPEVLLTPLLATLFLGGVSRVDYAVFHAMAEGFSIFTGLMLFTVAWIGYQFTRNGFLIYLGSGYLWVSLLDFFHLLAFEGAATFSLFHPHTALSHWMIARLLEGFVLATAVFMRGRSPARGRLLMLLGLPPLLLELLIIGGHFPVLAIPGQDQGNHRILVEFTIMAVIALGMAGYRNRERELDPQSHAWILWAMALTIVSEGMFTLDATHGSVPDLVGHLVKFLAFWVLFQGMVRAMLIRPFQAMQLTYGVFDRLPEAVLIARTDGTLLQINRRAGELLGVAPDSICGRTCEEVARTSGHALPPLEICGGDGAEGSGAREMKLGERWYEISHAPLGDWGLEGPARVIHLIRDITSRKQMELQELKHLRHQNALGRIIEIGLEPRPLEGILEECLTSLFQLPWITIESRGAVFLWDPQQSLLEMTAQVGLEGPLLERCRQVAPGECLCGEAARIRRPVFENRVEQAHTTRYPGMHPHGHYCIPIQAHGTLFGVLNLYVTHGHCHDPDEEAFLVMAANEIASIVQRSRSETLLRKFAQVDPLTDLLNRRGFEKALVRFITHLANDTSMGAVLFVDLDRFKFVNDTFGHKAGDDLIKAVSRRLQAMLRTGDALARPGGDEFIIAAQVKDGATAGNLAQRVIHAITSPIALGGGDAHVGASVGIALYPGDATTAEGLLQCADTAMFHAKETGRNRYAFFDGQVQETAMERQRLTHLLKGALKRGELTLHYQPQVEITTGVMVGAEALLRWTHPEMGAISPARFIPIAEESGAILPIGEWVLETACRQAMEWLREGLPPLRMGVNLSPRQLREPGLVETVQRILASTGMNPAHLELEITESATEGREEKIIIDTLNRLAALGVSLSIDDYGTGASSLKRLHQFPVSTLKIDRSFIMGLPADQDATTIVAATVALGRGLRMRVIAEGVETERHRNTLMQLHCHEMQGYLYEPPLPRNEFVRVLLENVAVQQLGERVDRETELRKLQAGRRDSAAPAQVDG